MITQKELDLDLHIRQARAIASLVADERWRELRGKLRAVCRRAVRRLMSTNLDLYELGRTQGFVQALRLILEAPTLSAETLAAMEKELQVLQNDRLRVEEHGEESLYDDFLASLDPDEAIT